MAENSEESKSEKFRKKELGLLPLTKTDWIRFGALKVQAKSRRIWQTVAMIAIVGLVAVTVTDGWLFMERQIRFERISGQGERLKEQNRLLSNKLSSLNEAIQHFSKAINMERDEKNLIAVEKGILQAQINLLMDEIATLEAAQRNNLKAAEKSIE